MTTTAGHPHFSNLVPQPVAGVGPATSMAGGAGRDGSRAIDRNNFPRHVVGWKANKSRNTRQE